MTTRSLQLLSPAIPTAVPVRLAFRTGISMLYQGKLELYTTESQVANPSFDAYLHQSLVVHALLPDTGQVIPFCGTITAVQRHAPDARQRCKYCFTFEPMIAPMQLEKDTRHFTALSIPAILDKLLHSFDQSAQ